MYEDFEIEISYKYLKEVINNLEEPICILGGWAVFFHVNKAYGKAHGRPYKGSKDVDLGFHLVGEIMESALSQTVTILKDQLKFKLIDFRYAKEINRETGEEIKDGEIVPIDLIFPISVDLIADNIPSNLKNIFGFNPIYEPLIKVMFDENEFTIIKEFEKKLLLPKPEVILAMKILSIPDREKKHKKLKDICDVFALLFYAGINPENVNLTKFISDKNLIRCIHTITADDYEKAAVQLGHSADEVRNVINILLH